MFKLASEPTDTQAILEQSAKLYWQALPFSLPYSFIIACLLSVPFFLVSSKLELELHSIIVILCAALLAFIFSNALLFHVYCYCSNVPSNLFFSLKQSIMKTPTLLFLMIAYILIVLSGAVLFIIPGIIVAFSMMFAFVLALTDNKATLQTLITSHQLVWPNWRHTFFTIFTPLMLNIVISLVFFITVVEYGLSSKLSVSSISIILAIINILIQTFFIPYLIDVTIVLLHDLRLRKALITPPWN